MVSLGAEFVCIIDFDPIISLVAMAFEAVLIDVHHFPKYSSGGSLQDVYKLLVASFY